MTRGELMLVIAAIAFAVLVAAFLASNAYERHISENNTTICSSKLPDDSYECYYPHEPLEDRFDVGNISCNRTSGYHYICSRIPQEIVEENSLKSKIADYFESQFVGGYTHVPVQDPSLSAIAYGNARNGTHSFKVVGNTADEAYAVFSEYDRTNYNYNGASFWNYAFMHQVRKYGIAVTDGNGQYNVSVVFNVVPPQKVEQNKNGAYQFVKSSEYVTYLW